MTCKTFFMSASLAALVAATPAAADLLSTSAMPAPEAVLTPNSGMPQLDGLKKYYPIPEFRIGGTYHLDADPETWRNGGEGGVTLESLGMPPLRTAYIDVGTPQYNDAGEITNAIIINPYYSGDSTFMWHFWFPGVGNAGLAGGDPIVGPGEELDTDKYYIVFLDALGLWGASKPSDGLGPDFPQYNYFDMVQANYQLLRDHLNVANVHLATGVSMGGTQTWVWGVMYSESGFVDAIMPIGGTTASDGGDPVGQWTYRLATAALESDPVWRATDARYYDLPKAEHPLQGLQFMWSILQSTGFDFKFRSQQGWEAVEKEVFYWEPEGNQTASYIARTQNEDPLDFWFRNMGGFSYNIDDELDRVKARTLVIHVENDNWLMVDNAKAAAEAVEGAGFLTFTDPTAHYGVFKAPNLLSTEVKAFVDNVNIPGTTAPGGGGGDAPEKPAGFSK